MQFPERLENTPFKLKVLNYSRNCSLHAFLIPNLVKPLIHIYIYNDFSQGISKFIVLGIYNFEHYTS